MKTKLTIAATLFFLVFISCNRDNTQKDLEVNNLATTDLKQTLFQTNENKKEPKIPIGTLPQLATDSSISQTPLKAVSKPDWDKKIIKTATLKLEVKDFKN